jgi:hypothetical protein
MVNMATFGSIIGVLVTIGFWSYLIKENPFFRIVEFTFVGFATAHATVMSIKELRSGLLNPLVSGNQYSLLIPLILGLLLYTRYSSEWNPLSRIPIALMVGVGTGVAVRAMVRAQLTAQIQATINPDNLVNGLIIAVLAIGSVVYFIFTSEENVPQSLIPVYRITQRIGRIAIMAAMGAAFGTLCVTRFTMAISRILEAVQLILG